MQTGTHLLEEIVDQYKHSPTKVIAAEEVEPWAFVHILLELLPNDPDFSFAVAIGGIPLGPELTE